MMTFSASGRLRRVPEDRAQVSTTNVKQRVYDTSTVVIARLEPLLHARSSEVSDTFDREEASDTTARIVAHQECQAGANWHSPESVGRPPME